MISLELDNAVKSFGKYLRHINSLLSPVIDVAYKLQEELGSINLKNVSTSKSGLWVSQACIDASTKVQHTENDCIYTIISMPKQIHLIGKKADKNIYFLFSPN